MVGQSTSISELEVALVDYFGNSFPGKSVFDYWSDGLLSLTGQDQAVAEIIELLSPKWPICTARILFGRFAVLRVDQSI